jgi:GNAT superfamily N-acetyltransferase
MKILYAEATDLQEILELQYIAYQSEAELVNNYRIQPLTQTYDEIVEEFQNGIFYKSIDNTGKIVGSVRGHEKEGTLYIGKLMVNPLFQGKGIGTKLLQTIEEDYKDLRKELFTSDLSKQNIKLYERNGYRKFQTKSIADGLNLIYLEKTEANL